MTRLLTRTGGPSWKSRLRRVRVMALAMGVGAMTATGCSDVPTDPMPPLASPDLEEWSSWVVPADADLGVFRRPSSDEVELQEIRALQSGLELENNPVSARWDALPSTPWTELVVDLIDRYVGTLPRNRVATPVRASRGAALLHIAIHDAIVAARHRKVQEARARPHVTAADIHAHVSYSLDFGFPSEHAAAAGAAATILAYIFPDENPNDFHAMAEEAGLSRVLGGVAFPSDVEAGLELGREVGHRVVALARTDGSEEEWVGSIPEGFGSWEPTPPRMTMPPYDPLAGSWRPWLLEDPAQFRPSPPPELHSPPFDQAMEELRAVEGRLTEDMVTSALYWATSAPSMRWHLYVEEEIKAHELDPLQAAYVHSLVSVAMSDAYLACWEAKYHFWLLRPITVDPSLAVLFPTPPFPAYPSGHSTVSAAAGETLAGLFPSTAERNLERAWTASESRIWGAVHFRFDAEAGKEQGARVAELALARARADGVLH
jgi:membrane-associated phospholipid phosphatase